MKNIIRSRQVQFLADQLQHFHVIVLFIADHINALVNFILVIFLLVQADILRDVHRCAISALHDLFIQSVGSKVDPNTAIFFLIKNSFIQSLFYNILTQQISIAFVIHDIKITADPFVSNVKSCIHPGIHCRPKLHHIRLSGFPVLQHLLRGLHDRRFFFSKFFWHAGGHQFFHLLFIFVVELHIILSHKMIALGIC